MCLEHQLVSATCTGEGQSQQDRLMSELKRVGVQQEQLKTAVSGAAAIGDKFELIPLKSVTPGETEHAMQTASEPKAWAAPRQAEASATAAPAEQASALKPAGTSVFSASCIVRYIAAAPAELCNWYTSVIVCQADSHNANAESLQAQSYSCTVLGAGGVIALVSS